MTKKDVRVTCSAAGQQRYNTSSRYSSSVTCQDPAVFCQGRFGSLGKCPNNCGLHGRCANSGKTLGLAQAETFERSKILGMSRKITIMGESENSNPWQCWCYNTTNFSTAANGSCTSEKVSATSTPSANPSPTTNPTTPTSTPANCPAAELADIKADEDVEISLMQEVSI